MEDKTFSSQSNNHEDIMTRNTDIKDIAERVVERMKNAEDAIKLKNLKKLGKSYNSLKDIIVEIKLSELFNPAIDFETIESYVLEDLQIMCEEKINKLEVFIESFENDFSKEMSEIKPILK